MRAAGRGRRRCSTCRSTSSAASISRSGQLQFDASLVRFARADVHADRRHGGARLLGRRRQLPAHRRRLPSRVHAAADGPRRAARGSASSSVQRQSATSRAEVYFAVTSNTVQFGARVELYYGVERLQRLRLPRPRRPDPASTRSTSSPRSGAMLGVRTGGRAVRDPARLLARRARRPGTRAAPARSRSASSSRSRSASASTSPWATRATRSLPPVDVLAEMRERARQSRNWRRGCRRRRTSTSRCASCPTGASRSCCIRSARSRSARSRAAPHRDPAVRRRARRARQRLHARRRADRQRRIRARHQSREQFAPAQFFDMSDAEKLSRPSFADYDAGIVDRRRSRREPTSCACATSPTR